MLINRLRPYLDDLIAPLQSSFIPGWRSTDTLVAQEVMYYMHHSKSKRCTLSTKIDLEKVHDRAKWVFLQSTIEDFSFPPGIVSLITFCVGSSSLTLLWNESKLDFFTPTRGLRQGDPISPHLFGEIGVFNYEEIFREDLASYPPSEWKAKYISHFSLLVMSCYLLKSVLPRCISWLMCWQTFVMLLG